MLPEPDPSLNVKLPKLLVMTTLFPEITDVMVIVIGNVNEVKPNPVVHAGGIPG
jgi:hypothetical protein